MTTKKATTEKKTVKTVKKTTPKTTKPEVGNVIAVISFGSHQYLIRPGDVIDVEKLNLSDNEKITHTEVLLYSDEKHTLVGTPFVDGVKVEMEHLKTDKDEKIRIARYKAKSRYRKVKGHRQIKTKLKVVSVSKG